MHSRAPCRAVVDALHGDGDARTRSARVRGGDDVAFEQQRVAEEAGDERGRGVGVQLGAGSALHDAAAVHDGDAVADHQRFALVVGDVDDRDAELAVDAGELELHGLA